MVEKEGGDEGWDVGIVLSGGNTSLEAIAALFSSAPESPDRRANSRDGTHGA